MAALVLVDCTSIVLTVLDLGESLQQNADLLQRGCVGVPGFPQQGCAGGEPLLYAAGREEVRQRDGEREREREREREEEFLYNTWFNLRGAGGMLTILAP